MTNPSDTFKGGKVHGKTCVVTKYHAWQRHLVSLVTLEFKVEHWTNFQREEMNGSLCL